MGAMCLELARLLYETRSYALAFMALIDVVAAVVAAVCLNVCF